MPHDMKEPEHPLDSPPEDGHAEGQYMVRMRDKIKWQTMECKWVNRRWHLYEEDEDEPVFTWRAFEKPDLVMWRKLR